jgi:peptidoglycan/LPS O-acetylase OafA/YrhL
MMIAVAASLTYGVAAADKMETWLSGRVFQWAGKISYSLYLGHATLLTAMLLAYGDRHGNWSPLHAFAWIVIVFVFSVGVSLLLFYCVEAPSHRLATRLRQSSKSAPATTT